MLATTDNLIFSPQSPCLLAGWTQPDWYMTVVLEAGMTTNSDAVQSFALVSLVLAELRYFTTRYPSHTAVERQHQVLQQPV